MTVTLDYQDKIAVCSFGSDENRFSTEFLDEFEAVLARVVADGAQALVTTGSGKFYSNGLDLDWLVANPTAVEGYLERVHALLARVLELPLPTVAAVPGHAFGAGAMLALAHDFRVMREDRGYFCLPEADIDIPFTKGMAALIQAKLSPQAAVATMTTGRRFGGADALRYAIVDATAGADQVTPTAIGVVAPLGTKNQSTVGAIKATMFADALAALTPVPVSA